MLDGLRTLQLCGYEFSISEKAKANLEQSKRDIKKYVGVLTQSKIGFSDFFIESTYKDPTGRTLPCYLITKKGCEFVANKLKELFDA